MLVYVLNLREKCVVFRPNNQESLSSHGTLWYRHTLVPLLSNVQGRVVVFGGRVCKEEAAMGERGTDIHPLL